MTSGFPELDMTAAYPEPMTPLPHGTWPSPITPSTLTAAQAKLDEVATDGPDTYWLEGRPWERGRSGLVRHDGRTDSVADVLPESWNVRSRVHEYGGGPYAVSSGTVVFSHFGDDRLWRLDPGSSEPVALTPEGDVRFGGLVIHGDLVYAVREDHRGSATEPVNELVRLSLHGHGGGGEGEGDGFGTVLASGTDFVSRPALSPDGHRIAWVSWDHPDMPWDSTLLHEASVEDLLAQPADAGAHVVAGGPGISAVQPTYAPDGRLWFLSDESNWWNPWTLEDGATRQALDVAADLATPQWVLGMRDLAFLADGRLVLRNPDPSTGALALLDPADRTLTPVPIEASHTELISTDGDEIALKRGLGDSLPEILRVRTDGSTTILATSSPEPIDPDYVSRAEEVSWANGAGLTAYGNFYAPTNAEVTGPEGELPPLLVFVHGGPTAQALPSYQSTVQFWTTRGFAVLDVNHGGSTGYGRDYRERLRGQWGVVDLDDCVTGAAAMAAAGRVDGARLAIRGGSAGGYTTLRALTASDVFAAGTSLYGISDLRALLVDDHKFESRYTIGLVGPWPEAEDVYLDRSPISHIGRLHGELLLLQGEDDKVVPLQQAQLMADGMAAAGKDVELVVYPGEGHGFRQASTIEDALTRELAFYQRVLGLG